MREAGPTRPEGLYPIAEAARRLNMDRHAVRRMVDEGALRVVIPFRGARERVVGASMLEIGRQADVAVPARREYGIEDWRSGRVLADAATVEELSHGE